MFYSIAIPGILQTWPGASIETELTTQTAYVSDAVARNARGERTSSSLERACTSVTMHKSTDSSDINAALSTGDAQVLDFGML